MRGLLAGVAGLLIPVSAFGVTLEEPYATDWMIQFGTETNDTVRNAATDNEDNLYLCGTTYGSLDGVSAGERDAFLTKVSSSGDVLWTRQWGTEVADEGAAVAVDGLGNVFCVGSTDGSLAGSNQGHWDVFVNKHDALGNLSWTRQLGTSKEEFGTGIAADGQGNVLVSGYTKGSLGGSGFGDYDVFLAKYDTTGLLLWKTQVGSSGLDRVKGMAIDSLGDIVVSGDTLGALGGPSGNTFRTYVCKFDASGNFQWAEQLFTGQNKSVTVDAVGNIIAGGVVGTDSNGYDAIVGKYDSLGNPLWERQFGTVEDESLVDVAVDSLDNVFVTGSTEGTLGQPNAGHQDIFVVKYHPSGELCWTEQLGSSGDDIGTALAVDCGDNLFLGGAVGGSVAGPWAGGNDIFAEKMIVPEPSTIILLTMGAVALLAYAWRKRRSR